jgi:molybdate transport system regulatory protein
VERGKEIALGPGKVELLEHIAASGSIAEAAARMEMSYMRAWKLVKTMEACFRQPLVDARRGGSARGGATLTKAGTEVLKLYREMDAACVRTTGKQWVRLRRHLRH